MVAKAWPEEEFPKKLQRHVKQVCVVALAGHKAHSCLAYDGIDTVRVMYKGQRTVHLISLTAFVGFHNVVSRAPAASIRPCGG